MLLDARIDLDPTTAHALANAGRALTTRDHSIAAYAYAYHMLTHVDPTPLRSAARAALRAAAITSPPTPQALRKALAMVGHRFLDLVARCE